ncbi:hypothetical protein [Microbacterium terrisoli]|uniref:hypothetical protein n=1 Tax=Microbacterium terrisoli TaxID=3242192 RepID=UPI002804C18D|nr:hypothetical protein [Microbacterium protaetiae]
MALVVSAVYARLRPLVPQPGLAAGVAGAAAGVIADLTYRWLKVPEAAMAMAGIIVSARCARSLGGRAA